MENMTSEWYTLERSS